MGLNAAIAFFLLMENGYGDDDFRFSKKRKILA